MAGRRGDSIDSDPRAGGSQWDDIRTIDDRLTAVSVEGKADSLGRRMFMALVIVDLSSIHSASAMCSTKRTLP
jgi:hypothetical protein